MRCPMCHGRGGRWVEVSAQNTSTKPTLPEWWGCPSRECRERTEREAPAVPVIIIVATVAPTHTSTRHDSINRIVYHT